MQKTPELCPLCGRVDNGAPRCRDHSERPKRVLVKLDKEAAPHE